MMKQSIVSSSYCSSGEDNEDNGEDEELVEGKNPVQDGPPQELTGTDHDTDNNNNTEHNKSSCHSAGRDDIQYDEKKPKWWRRVAGRRGSKAQRRAYRAMASHKLPSIPYGEFYDLSQIFGVSTSTTTASTSDAINTSAIKGNDMNPKTTTTSTTTEPISSNTEIWLEIGCGQGHVLLANAERHAKNNVKIIGADIHKAGVGLALLRIQAAIQSGNYWKDYNVYSANKDPLATLGIPLVTTPTPFQSPSPTTTTTTPMTISSSEELQSTQDDQEEHRSGQSQHSSSSSSSSSNHADDDQGIDLYDNVRIFPGDGMKLLHSIRDSSLSVLLMTFPDPWPRDDTKQYRLLQHHTLIDLHRTLTYGGRFFLATDHPVFLEWSVQLFAETTATSLLPPFQRIEPCPPRSEWLPVISKYEQKGWDEGRCTYLACWAKGTI